MTLTPEQEIQLASSRVSKGWRIDRATIRRVGQIAKSLGVERGSRERYDIFLQRLLLEFQKEKPDE